MVRIGIVVVMATAGTALAAPAPALCPSNAPAMVRPAPCTSLPPSHSRTTGFEPVCRPIVPCDPIPCRTPCFDPCNDWQPIGPGVWINGVWYDQPIVVPAAMETVQVDVNVDADQALVDLLNGRYREAAGEFLRRHEERVLEEANTEGGAVPDRTALRLHALALAGAGDFAEASRAFARAYAEDPVMASVPLDGAELLGSRAELRRIVVGAVRFAHRTGDGGMWTTVGRLMEAEGRFQVAERMFERASAVN